MIGVARAGDGAFLRGAWRSVGAACGDTVCVRPRPVLCSQAQVAWAYPGEGNYGTDLRLWDVEKREERRLGSYP
ncbi:MAG: hypothetical protein R6X20_12365 [Phycisphaerae bacterium]